MIRIRAKEIAYCVDQTRRQAETAAVRACLSSLGIEAQLSHRSSGAPYIKDCPEVVVSITHSRQWAVVALGELKDAPFGIDVENANRIQLQRVAPRVLSSEELTAALSESQGFVKAWTAKEAVFKAVSVDGVDFKNDIRLLSPGFSHALYDKNKQKFDLTYIILAHDSLLCLASKGNNFEFKTL